MNRRTFLGALSTAAVAAAPRRPNIVFIMTDDQRWDSMGCAGHPYLKTPNLDRLAREGAMFQNVFVTTPLCSPSRASFLTGLRASKHGIVDNTDRGPQSHELMTYPRILQKHGYETAFIGKWHMDHQDDSARPGFDHWISFKGQGRYDNPPLNRNGARAEVPGYLTDILTQEAVEFIRRKHDKPFAMCVWHKSVHDPTTPAERHKTAFSGESIPRRPNYEDQLDGKPAMFIDGNGKPVKRGRYGGPAEEKIKNQMRCLLSVEEGVGSILAALEETGQLDDTLVVFSSDNGYFWGEHKLGDKRRAYEEGLRVPLLMRYPRLIRAGSRPTQMVLNTDLAPTFLQLAGVKPGSSMDGMSVLPLFGRKKPRWRTSFTTEYFLDPGYLQTPRWRSVRTERWKYIHYQDVPNSEELYDLAADPFEMKNVIGEAAAARVVSSLRPLLR
jgi:N-acetylglucosamine-6-sulfatase